MARAHFSDACIDFEGNRVACKVTVRERASQVLATLFATEHASSAMTNPYLADDGIVSHWADAGAYDVLVEDEMFPPRVEPRTVGWGAVPGVDGGIPARLIQAKGITAAQIADLSITNNVLAGSSVTPDKMDNATRYRNSLVDVHDITLPAATNPIYTLGSQGYTQMAGLEIMGRVTVNPAIATQTWIQLVPDGGPISPCEWTLHRSYFTGAANQHDFSSGAAASLLGFVLAQGDWNAPSQVVFKSKLWTREGGWKVCLSEYANQPITNPQANFLTGTARTTWRNTVSDIFTLQIVFNASNNGVTIHDLMMRRF